MSDETWNIPPERDYNFYQRRKHDKWREVPAPDPRLEAPIADTHAHVHLLPEPLWELERAAANGVQLVSCVADPSEDILDGVFALAQEQPTNVGVDTVGIENELDSSNSEAAHHQTKRDTQTKISNSNSSGNPIIQEDTREQISLPTVIFTIGVHPHNAKEYSQEVEDRLVKALAHPQTRVLGEIGLDYFYDISPRETQQRVFKQQLNLARELNLPVALHLRSGQDPDADNAHHQAFEILEQEGMLGPNLLLHCCSLPEKELKPWIEADCYIAYGGAFTFKKSNEARAAAHLVPRNRLLLETDSPYMAPEPMRGVLCTPAHTIFTAATLADELGCTPGSERQALLQDIWDNTHRFFHL